MRYISIEETKAGMIVAAEVCDSKNRVIVNKGAALTDVYIERMKEQGYPGLYIGDPVSADIQIEPPISPILRNKAVECVKSGDVDCCLPIADSIIKELISKEIVSLDMYDLRSLDDFTYGHSVNVAVFCCVLGIGVHLPESELSNLVTAALLHDFGKAYIPSKIIYKNGRLTGEEYDAIKAHAQISYDLIKDNTGINAEIKNAVLGHHENEDGSGYPQGLAGNNISYITKILHVADVFDALTSDRPYKKGYSYADASEFLMGGCGIMFDKNVVDNFMKLVPMYPLGSRVHLSNGDDCIVVRNTGVNNLRPVVRRISDLRQFDLSDRANMSITIRSKDEDEILKSEAERKQMVNSAERKKLVVVDDMKTNLQMLREILSMNYDLVLLKSAKQALHYLEKSNAPDLILMDIDMPEMNGIEAAEIINSRYGKQIPILFVSALSDINTVMACRKIGAAGYIVRPYKPVYILSEISRILEGQEAY